MHRLALALLSLVLISCAMGPDYTRPGVSTPESFRMAGKEGESIANLPWWELLRDDELQKLVRIALNENKDLKQAVASVEEYQARLYIARTDFAPQLSVSGNAPLAKMGGVGFPGFPSAFSYYGQGSLSWELDFWGRVRRENEAARADLFAREENRRAVILQLVSGVAQAYFDLRQLDMQLDIARRTSSAVRAAALARSASNWSTSSLLVRPCRNRARPILTDSSHARSVRLAISNCMSNWRRSK